MSLVNGAARTDASCEVAGAAEWPTAGPWSIRLATGSGRPALEVYEHGELIDVLVASSLGGALLRGARRGTVADQPAGFAWGRLAADGAAPAVLFAGGRLRPEWRPARVMELDGGFWLAWAPGPLAGVLVRDADGRAERLRPAR
ncbi:hypothetical protein [Kitasatospora sp. LaBMicrA B282]|uniref:hypothetical protein n=1 Tax=Kitasatospora sp. LaBMicrA B282 TaxID=3420949 RepID=UPI003D0C7FA3